LKRLFIESSVFKKLIDGLENKELERNIKNEILKDPAKGDLIKGTGGFRKIRVGKEGRGKSGGYRVIYFDCPEAGVTYLYILLDKSIKVDLSSSDKKWLLNQAQELKMSLGNQRG
jgi:hypothetical protein